LHCRDSVGSGEIGGYLTGCAKGSLPVCLTLIVQDAGSGSTSALADVDITEVGCHYGADVDEKQRYWHEQEKSTHHLDKYLASLSL
jgi:hypothetical protein